LRRIDHDGDRFHKLSGLVGAHPNLVAIDRILGGAEGVRARDLVWLKGWGCGVAQRKSADDRTGTFDGEELLRMLELVHTRQVRHRVGALLVPESLVRSWKLGFPRCEIGKPCVCI